MARIRSIAELNRQLQAQKKRLVKLQSQRAKLLAGLQTVDKQITSLTGQVPPVPVRVAKAGKKAARPGRKGRARKSLTACLIAALASTKGSARAMDLADAVVKAGYVTKDKNFKNTVAKTLGKDKRFKRVGRGMYKLAATKK